jgi:hypothetical protein
LKIITPAYLMCYRLTSNPRTLEPRLVLFVSGDFYVVPLEGQSEVPGVAPPWFAMADVPASFEPVPHFVFALADRKSHFLNVSQLYIN